MSVTYSAWHESYRKGVERNLLDRVGPLERLHLHVDDAGIIAILERRISTVVGNDGIVHELWENLTSFSIPGHERITTAELWKQAWMYTGKREYGERVPEA